MERPQLKGPLNASEARVLAGLLAAGAIDEFWRHDWDPDDRLSVADVKLIQDELETIAGRLRKRATAGITAFVEPSQDAVGQQ